MRRFLATLLVITAAIPAVTQLPEIDLSAYSFDQLVELRSQVDEAIWASDGWQEVTVPVGTYRIGEDIPAGRWTITPTQGRYAWLEIAEELEPNGIDVGSKGFTYTGIYSPDSNIYDEGDATEITWTLKEGMYLRIKESAVIFTPGTGFSFGFK